jgi:predicted acyltransferase
MLMDSQRLSGRLLSLDAFRGVTIAGMILVNNPGSTTDVYKQLQHAAWNGWTFTDTIFPSFLWIVGVAITLSFTRRGAHGHDKSYLLLNVVRRSVIIFALGLFLSGFPFGLFLDTAFALANMRIPGVLQRIAVCYLLASLVFFTPKPSRLIVWTCSLLVIYWVLLKLVRVPGYGYGVLEPAGNLCWYVDSIILNGHTWGGSPVEGFDPEGIVSTIPAVATILFGALTGQWLYSSRSPEEKVRGMFLAGIALLVLGQILNIWLPINKNLWTSSYAVFMAGWASVWFTWFYWLIDVKGYTKWAVPFNILGMNAITVYVLSGLVAKLTSLVEWMHPDGYPIELREYIFDTVFAPHISPVNASLAYAATFLLIMFLVAWLMWKKRWFLKV